MLKLRAYYIDATNLLYMNLFVPKMFAKLNMNYNNGKNKIGIEKDV